MYNLFLKTIFSLVKVFFVLDDRRFFTKNSRQTDLGYYIDFQCNVSECGPVYEKWCRHFTMGGRDGGVRTKNTNNVNNTNKFKGAPLHGHKVNCKLS